MRATPVVQSLTEPLLSPLVSAISGVFGNGWNPISLFTSGQQGYAYDLNDGFAEKTAYRRNLLTYSEQFDNAAWTKTNATVTANSSVAPDGTTTADLLVADTANAQHRVNFATTVAAGTYTFSAYIKAGGYNFTWIRIGSNGGYINLTNGDVTSVSVGYSLITTAVGNGWYRVALTGTAALNDTVRINALDSASSTDFSGNGTSGILVWGAQLEAGVSATEYQRVTDWNTELLAAFPQTALYLDSAGTTAATVNGLVGLVLDKSKGLALGAELLSSGAIGVTGTATAATYNTSTGAGTVTRVDSSNQSFVTFTGLTSTAFYQVTIQNTGSNILSFRQGTFASTILGDINVGQTKTFISLATTSQLTVTMSPVAGSGSFVISTFKAVAGNHAYQATSGSRPILRGTPTGANLVTNGDFASDTVWTKGIGWTIGSGVATKTAGAAQSIFQAITPTVGNIYRITYTITVTAGVFQPFLGGGTSVFGALRTASGTYVEYLTAAAGNNSVGITTNTTSAGTVDNVEVVDVSAGSVQAPYALQFDGVDDFLQTASVNFTATDKMTVCHGVRKLSDAASGVLVELTASADGNFNSFNMAAPYGAAATFSFQSRGSGSTAVASASGSPSPALAVITGIGDIATDTSVLRKNGTQVASSAVDQGTGNYANAVLYFGRRNGASLPYNGLMFSAICVGKATSATELANIERWVNQRTGAY